MQLVVNKTVCHCSNLSIRYGIKRGYSNVATALRQPPASTTANNLLNNKNKNAASNNVRLGAIKDLFQTTTIPKNKVYSPLSTTVKTSIVKGNLSHSSNNNNSTPAANNKTIVKGGRPKRDEEITSRLITFVDENGTVHQRKKLSMALQEFDRSLYFLIEVDPTSHPPVCRLFEKKQLFEKEKANKKKKKTNTPEQITKEINFGWNVSLHDMGHKLTKAIQFLEKGNKVKIEILHKKGQQRVDKDTQQEVIDQVQQQLKDFKLSKPPTRSGSNCMMQFELRK